MQFPFLLQEHIMTGDWLRTKDMDHLSTVIREETVVMKVFDFDNTIYRGESSIDLAVYMIRNNKKIILYLPMIFTNLVKYKLCMVGRKEMEIILNDFCQAVMGDKDEVPEIIDRFWQIHAHKLNRKILKRIGPEDIIITAGPDILINGIRDRLHTDHIICSEVDLDGRRFDQLGGQGTVLCLLSKRKSGDKEPSPVSPARAVSQEKNRPLCTESAEGPVFDS